MDDRIVIRDVEQDGGGEVLVGVLFCLRSPLAGVPAKRGVQVDGESGEGGLAVGGSAEGAEQQGRVVDRGQAAAADVTDEEPGAVVGGPSGGVEVSTEVGFFLGGDVQAGDPQRAGAGGQRLQQHTLRRLGHRSHPAQLPLTPVAHHADGDTDTGDDDQGSDLGLEVGGVQSPLSTPISIWAATARAPISAVTRAPANATVMAGAATSSGPRWICCGASTSTTQTVPISPRGTATSAGA